MKKIILALFLSGLFNLSFAADAEKIGSIEKDTCVERKKISRSYFFIMNLSLRTDNQKSLEKFLFEKCLSPIRPKDPEIVEDPIFSIVSIDSYKKMQQAGADFTLLNEHGMDYFDFTFSYQRPYNMTDEDAALFHERATSLLKVLPKGFITQAELDKHDYKRLNSKEKYDNFLKFLLDKFSDRVTKNAKGFGRDIGITPLHYTVYNGNYEIFKHIIDNFYGEKINPNIENERGQPLFALVLNHFCGMDEQSINGLKKINEILLSQKDIDFEKVFRVNDERVIKVNGLITYKDLLLKYKKVGNKEIFEQTLSLLQKYHPNYFEKLNFSDKPAAGLTDESMLTGICYSPSEVAARFYDL